MMAAAGDGMMIKHQQQRLPLDCPILNVAWLFRGVNARSDLDNFKTPMFRQYVMITTDYK
jgi:hypothetical protein